MTKEAFRAAVKKLHPDMNGGSNRWRGALEMVMRHKPTKRKKCRCGVVIRESSENCAMCHRRRRHRRVRAVIVLGLLMMFIGCKTPTPKVVHTRGHMNCQDVIQPPMPPGAVAKIPVRKIAPRIQAAAAPVPKPPRTTVEYEITRRTNGLFVSWEHSTNLTHWTFGGLTNGNRVSFPTNEKQKFFRFTEWGL